MIVGFFIWNIPHAYTPHPLKKEKRQPKKQELKKNIQHKQPPTPKENLLLGSLQSTYKPACYKT